MSGGVTVGDTFLAKQQPCAVGGLHRGRESTLHPQHGVQSSASTRGTEFGGRNEGFQQGTLSRLGLHNDTLK